MTTSFDGDRRYVKKLVAQKPVTLGFWLVRLAVDSVIEFLRRKIAYFGGKVVVDNVLKMNEFSMKILYQFKLLHLVLNRF